LNPFQEFVENVRRSIPRATQIDLIDCPREHSLDSVIKPLTTVSLAMMAGHQRRASRCPGLARSGDPT
jgi:hypothetical protein